MADAHPGTRLLDLNRKLRPGGTLTGLWTAYRCAAKALTSPPDGARWPDTLVHQLCDLAEIRTGAAGTTTRLHMRLNTG